MLPRRSILALAIPRRLLRWNTTQAGDAFEPRKGFAMPTTVPSWYAGHMARAIRSMPHLLARYPPPLVVEVRDARLPLTSINPVFETLLRSSQNDSWSDRRLVVYTKRDLIDPKLEAPLKEAFARRGQEVIFVDTRVDKDVRRVLGWVNARARQLVEHPGEKPKPKSERAEKKAMRTLSGAFRHTMTPEEGVRLLILGMPNVGKSSLLNALRRVGTGKAKAASTAPTPGHTRKLTGTVRITKQGLESEGSPPVYVYDSPGVMVPFLGHGPAAAEKALKLAVAAGIKTSLFDIQLLADYLLYRINRRNQSPPAYISEMPTSADMQPTNSIEVLLENLAERSPGTMAKGGVRDLDAAAEFFVQRWREGKVGKGELDLAVDEERIEGQSIAERVEERVAAYFQAQSEEKNVPNPVITEEDDDANATTGVSHNQAKKTERKKEASLRLKKLREKGILTKKNKPVKSSKLPSFVKRRKK